MSFWQTLEVERVAPPPSPRAHGPAPRCSQNDLRGICDYCHCERDDVLLGICAHCEEVVDRVRP